MTIDPVTLTIIENAFIGIAEEMNSNLIRTGYSPNIKERRDCSSALFDRTGQMIAQAESIPVHLGAMPFSVRAILARFHTFARGDTVVANDPFAGGAHLPDITFLTPIFHAGEVVAFAVNRAHHADVGGMRPGSVAGDATEIYQEGLRLPPVKLWRGGTLDSDLMDIIAANVRTPDERRGDLRAQMAANATGQRRFHELIARYGIALLDDAITAIMDRAELRMRAAIAAVPDGTYQYADRLDNDGIIDRPVRIAVTIHIAGDEVTVDFSTSAPQVDGPINAVYAVTAAAVYYALRAVIAPDIPPNAGCYRPITIIAPPGTVVNARPPAAVVGGNLETAQRIVDVLLGALAVAMPDRTIAACQGTMNNVTIGGIDPRTGQTYTVYETIGGGFGARPDKDGIDGIQCHMTNTLNTPIEALEIAYPLRVERYELRRDSGGAGRYQGGAGIRRDIRVVGHRARVSLLADRRITQPYGIAGGSPGAAGADYIITATGERRIAGKGSFLLAPDEIISIRTPGGGGYGDPATRLRADIVRDYRAGRISAQYARDHYRFDPRTAG